MKRVRILAVICLAISLTVAAPESNRLLCSGEPSRPFDQYICDTIKNNGPLSPQCEPVRRIARGTEKGLVVAFHGFSACPDSFAPLADELQRQGYHVLNFLNPGHGLLYNACSAVNCTQGYPTGNLPVKRAGYEAFVKQANKIVREEVAALGLNPNQHTIGVMGLSLGAALSFYAAQDAPDLYNKLIPMSPFLGLAAYSADKTASKCDSDLNHCIRSFLRDLLKSNFVDHSPAGSSTHSEQLEDGLAQITEFWKALRLQQLSAVRAFSQIQKLFRFGLTLATEQSELFPRQIDSVFESEVAWGRDCEAARNQTERGGYCAVKFKNIAAAHSFGQLVLSRSRLIKASIGMILVERDGPTRNSMALSLLPRHSVSYQSQVCMFETVCPVIDGNGNQCGVPHSSLSRAENVLITPHVLYWEANLIREVVIFLSEENPNLGVRSNHKDRSVCTGIGLPDPRLPSVSLELAQVRVTLFTNFKDEAELLSIQIEASSDLAKFLGIKDESMVNVLSTNFDAAGMLEILFEVPVSLADKVQSLIASRRITSLAGCPIVSSDEI